MNTLVSIIMPSYNSEDTIFCSIESVVLQTYHNWELIIIDDCSVDNTVNIIKDYSNKDDRIKLIQLNTNNGPAIARNKGIKKSQGRYISFLDSDDIWMPKKLDIQIKFMKMNKLALTYSSYNVINELGVKIKTRITKKKITFDDMLKSNFIGNLTGIYDCKILGKYYMDSIGHEDYALWLNIMKDVQKTQGVLEPLAGYRISLNSVSSNKINAAKWQWHIYRNIAKLSLFVSLYYLIWYIYYALRKRM